MPRIAVVVVVVVGITLYTHTLSDHRTSKRYLSERESPLLIARRTHEHAAATQTPIHRQFMRVCVHTHIRAHTQSPAHKQLQQAYSSKVVWSSVCVGVGGGGAF